MPTAKTKRNTSPYFWTDYEQARRRLQMSVVLYHNDPFFIEQIREGAVDEGPVALGRFEVGEKQKILSLSDPGFSLFRRLPNLGFVNVMNNNNDAFRALLVKRRSRRIQTHGLNSENIHLIHIGDVDEPLNHQFESLAISKEFKESHLGMFPNIGTILENIVEDSSVAFNRHYAILKSSEGVSWLYKEDHKVGLFSNNNTLLLFNKMSFLREELIETKDPFFSSGVISEF